MSWIPGTVDSRLLLFAPTETIVSDDTMTLSLIDKSRQRTALPRYNLPMLQR